MQIYIYRGKEEFGPYSVEAVVEYVRQGVFQLQDFACYAGMAEWKTVRDLLGIMSVSESPRRTTIQEFLPMSESGRIRASTTMLNDLPPLPVRARRRKRRIGMIVMSIIVVLIILIVLGCIYVRRNSAGDIGGRYPVIVSSVLGKPANEAAPATSSSSPAPAVASAPAIAKESAAPAAPALAAPSAVALAESSAAPATTVPGIAKVTLPIPSHAPVAASSPAPAAAAQTPAALTAALPTHGASTPATKIPASGQGTAAVSTPPPLASAPAPPAAPKPFSIADLAGNQAAWPKIIKLKQSVMFPAVFDSQNVGSVSVPAGTQVRLTAIQGDQVTVEFQGGTQNLDWRLTDIDEESARVAAAPPSAPPAASLPVATPPPSAPVATPPPDAGGTPPSNDN
ncbi:MAG: DUF4339 domain-containing protein [Chthoniobacteraceae bacterium]|jgi:hypothetical protein